MRTHNTEIGAGQVLSTGDKTRLVVPAADSSSYHDAQITDYTLADRDFVWGPGTHLSVTAQFNTADVRGTAGFGFWNHPFSPEMCGLPRLPQAAWFFYGSPPHNIPLAKGVPGAGWKAATLNATRWQFMGLAPLALPGFLLMRVPAVYNALWPVGQDAIGVRECLLPPDIMTERHTYTIDWREDEIVFGVDGDAVLVSPFRQRGRMGFIAWVDNQYAVVTPQGNFGWGLLDVPGEQSLSLYEIGCVR
ncbi:MAG: family 16 glycosylhydrolase [Chloroflexota bacterium]